MAHTYVQQKLMSFLLYIPETCWWSYNYTRMRKPTNLLLDDFQLCLFHHMWQSMAAAIAVCLLSSSRTEHSKLPVYLSICHAHTHTHTHAHAHSHTIITCCCVFRDNYLVQQYYTHNYVSKAFSTSFRAHTPITCSYSYNLLQSTLSCCY